MMSTLRNLLVSLAGMFGLIVTAGPLRAQECQVREIGTDESKAASLASGDCRLRDLVPGSRSDSYAHPYRVTLPADGILTIDLRSTNVDAYLYLYSLAYTAIASNDNVSRQSADAQLLISLRKGTYLLVASTRGATAGSYTLQTAFASRPSCPELEAQADAPLDGQLTTDSCRVMDIYAPSRDTSRAAAYRLKVPLAGVLTVKMTGKGFSPFLEILDSRRENLFYGNAEGDPEIEMTAGLRPGTYVLIASTSEPGATGAFTLTAALSEPRQCEQRDLAPGESVKAELADGKDCRFLDVLQPSEDTTPLDVYRVTVGKRGVLSLSLSSADFTPYLALYDEKGNELNNTGEDEDPGTTARMTTSLAAGKYQIYANTWDLDGAYTLLSSFTESRPCPIADVRPGETMQGTTAADSCRILDLVDGSADASLASGYRLAVPERRILTADQASSQFDALVYLFGPGSKLLAIDDDGAGGRNSRLTTLLSPGTYLLAASSAGGAETGAFTLTARLAEAPDCAVSPLELGATVSGQLAAGDCRTREAVVGATGGSYVRSYRVTFAETGRLQVEVSSRTMAMALVLTDSESGTIVYGTTELNGSARFEEKLAPGTYLVHVVTMTAAQTGSFTLQSAFEPGG